MESYLLKSAACLAIFYWFYKLLLENENMHTFKRCYLLVMLIFSFLIPLISFNTNVVSTKTISPIVFTNLNIEDANNFFLLEILPLLLGTIYLIGVVFFSFRFGKNLFSLIVKIKKNPKLKAPSHVNVLLKNEVIPHTFLKYIFLNQSKFETKKNSKRSTISRTNTCNTKTQLRHPIHRTHTNYILVQPVYLLYKKKY